MQLLDLWIVLAGVLYISGVFESCMGVIKHDAVRICIGIIVFLGSSGYLIYRLQAAGGLT